MEGVAVSRKYVPDLNR